MSHFLTRHTCSISALISDIWYLVSNIWYQISDIWYLIFDNWYLIFDVESFTPSSHPHLASLLHLSFDFKSFDVRLWKHNHPDQRLLNIIFFAKRTKSLPALLPLEVCFLPVLMEGVKPDLIRDEAFSQFWRCCKDDDDDADKDDENYDADQGDEIDIAWWRTEWFQTVAFMFQ